MTIGKMSIFALVALVSFSLTASVWADPFSKRCNYYSSPKKFVKEAKMYCLSNSSATCEAKAERYFARCRYSGDFDLLNKKAHARIILLMMLARISPNESRRVG